MFKKYFKKTLKSLAILIGFPGYVLLGIFAIIVLLCGITILNILAEFIPTIDNFLIRKEYNIFNK